MGYSILSSVRKFTERKTKTIPNAHTTSCALYISTFNIREFEKLKQAKASSFHIENGISRLTP